MFYRWPGQAAPAEAARPPRAINSSEVGLARACAGHPERGGLASEREALGQNFCAVSWRGAKLSSFW